VTHSLVIAPALALLLTAAVRLFGPLRWGQSWLAAITGILSHLLLDWLTMPGPALLWPFRSERSALDVIGPADFWPAILLSVGVAAPFLSGLVSLEIGAENQGGRRSGVAALLLLGGYAGFRCQLQQTALAALDSRVYGGVAAVRTAASPNSFDPFLWMGLVETPAAIHVVPVDLRTGFDPEAGETLYRVSHAAIEAARNSALTARLRPQLIWVHWEAIPVGERMEVTGEELRLGLVMRFETNESQRIVDAAVQPR
jgi:hypothetical protein